MPTDKPMQLGMVGLGRMGAGIVRRLTRDGHRCVGYDVNADAVQAIESDGIAGARTLEEFAAKLETPRAAWVMVPAGEITSKTIRSVAEVFEPGDVIIDGGNTHYHDDIRHAAELGEKGIHHVDVRHQRRRVGPRARLLPDDRRRGRTSSSGCTRCSGRSPPGSTRRTARPGASGRPAHPSRASCTAVPTAPGTSSRWSTTGSSTGSWPRTPRGSTSSTARTSARRCSTATPRPLRWSTPSTTSTTSTPPR